MLKRQADSGQAAPHVIRKRMVYLLRGFPTVLTDGCWRGTRDAPRWLSEEAAAASTTDWEEIPMGY